MALQIRKQKHKITHWPNYGLFVRAILKLNILIYKKKQLIIYKYNDCTQTTAENAVALTLSLS